MKKLKLILILLLLSKLTYSQKSVSGVIKDETGQTLPGAIVMNNKTGEKILSDIEGKFVLNAKQKDKITINFIGYEPVEIKVTDKYYFEINLEIAKRKISRSEKRKIKREIKKNGSYVFPN